MKVLVGVPFHPKKTYAISHVLEWVEKQHFKTPEVVMRWHLGPFGEQNAVKTQREFFRKLAIEQNFDYFYSMGADTIPPLDALPRLLAHNRDVVGCVYRQRKDNNPQVIAWRHGDDIKRFMNSPESLVMVDGMGMDAVLFSRKAFTSTGYFEWGQSDDDYPYYDLLKARGFDIWLDKSLVCKHYMETDKFV